MIKKKVRLSVVIKIFKILIFDWIIENVVLYLFNKRFEKKSILSE